MGEPSDLPKLRAKHARFVQEYLVDFNGTQAAIRAGYSGRSARFTAAELLCRDDIQAHIQRGQAEAAEVAGVTRKRVLEELAAIAFADLRDVISWAALQDPETGERGRLLVQYKDSRSLTAAQAAAIAELRQDQHGFRLKMHSKLRALELLAKHLRLMDKDEVENNEAPARLTPENIGEVIERARLYAVATGRKASAG